MVFSLAPGSIPSNAVIDLDDAANRKVYYKSIEGLDPKIDLKPEILKLFLEKESRQATNYGWTSFLRIPSLTTPGTSRNLLQHYGLVTLEDCRDVATNHVGAHTRLCQVNHALTEHLMDSLTPDAISSLATESHNYTVNGIVSAVCYLHCIISKCTVNSVATVDSLRNQISTLDVKIDEFQGDVSAFNSYVLDLRSSMIAHGEAIPELNSNVLRAYEKIHDENFKLLIRTKKMQMQLENKPIEVTQLMHVAENQYKIQLSENTWGHGKAKSDVEAFVAMQSEFTSFMAQKTRGSKPSGKTSSTVHAKSKTTKLTAAERKAKYAWKIIKPTKGQKWIDFEERRYYWCPNHRNGEGLWCQHRASECKNGPDAGKSTSNSVSTKPSLKLKHQAYASVDEGDEEENEDEEFDYGDEA